MTEILLTGTLSLNQMNQNHISKVCNKSLHAVMHSGLLKTKVFSI